MDSLLVSSSYAPVYSWPSHPASGIQHATFNLYTSRTSTNYAQMLLMGQQTGMPASRCQLLMINQCHHQSRRMECFAKVLPLAIVAIVATSYHRCHRHF